MDDPSKLVEALDCEADWSVFKERFFPHTAHNLNPATLGALSSHAREQHRLAENASQAFPLGQYSLGRDALAASQELAKRIWSAPDFHLDICAGTTQTVNLLLLAARIRHHEQGFSPKRKIRLLCTAYEHTGGISGFAKHPAFELTYIGQDELKNPECLASLVTSFQPDLAFFLTRPS